MSSLQPLSGAAMSALIQEIESGSSALFGNPFAGSGAGASVISGKLARVMNLLRRKVVPRVWRSLNETQVTVVRRTRIADDEDPLAYRYATSEQALDATIGGPTAETLEREWQVVPDYDVLIPAAALTPPLTEQDGIKIAGVTFDVVGIEAHPKVPAAVAYRYTLARAA